MEESSSSPSSAAAAAEYEPLLLRLDSHSQIPRLSSESIQHLMERRSAVERRWWPRLIASESRVLWKLCGSSIAVSILNYMLTFFTLMLAGHLGILPFAAASIAAVGFQALAYAIMVSIYFDPFSPIHTHHFSLFHVRLHSDYYRRGKSDYDQRLS